MLILGVMGVKAQEWRGFIEIYAGTQTSGRSNVGLKNISMENVSNPLTFGLNYTMGMRVLPQFYAGVGIGGYTALIYEDNGYFEHSFPSLYFPVFVNARWIPDVSKKINPYVDLKIGYQFGTGLEEKDSWYSDRYQYEVRHKNGLFLQPGFGIRFGRDSAFNLGLAYNVFMGRDFVALDMNVIDLPIAEEISKNYGSIMITFGADF